MTAILMHFPLECGNAWEWESHGNGNKLTGKLTGGGRLRGNRGV